MEGVEGRQLRVAGYEGKVVEREISVTSGKEAVVAVNMLK